MDREHIIDGLRVIQRKRGRNVDQGDVEMLELAITALAALPEVAPSKAGQAIAEHNLGCLASCGKTTEHEYVRKSRN